MASGLLKVPFFVIAYNTKKLFAIDSDKGDSTLPVFTEAEAAELYRRYFAKKFKLKLQVFVVDKTENALSLIECASLSCNSLQYVVINPFLPSPNITQPESKQIQKIITSLRSQCRKGRNRQSPHKK